MTESSDIRGTKHDRKLAGILEAAAEVFAESGYDRASIRMVAERARVSVAGLYHYVRSKEELLYLIQYHVFDGLVDAYKVQAADISDPTDRLKLLISNHLKRFMANMSELVVCSREIDRLVGDFRSRIESKQREYYNLARNIFAELAEQHGGGSVEPRTAALALFGSINWIYTWYRPRSGPSAGRMAEDFVRLYVQGFVPSE